MKRQNKLKILLVFFLIALLFTSCSAEDKLVTEIQDAQTNVGGLNTIIPTWSTDYAPNFWENEISKDGSYIPQVFQGIYDIVSSTYPIEFIVDTATIYSNRVTHAYTHNIKKDEYIEKNAWFIKALDMYIKFTRNEKGQRILILNDIVYDKEYTNIFIHRDDKNK